MATATQTAQTANTQTIEFAMERETKNTVRYAEQSDAPVIGTLYVQKLALKGMSASGFPANLTVTITAS